MRTQATNCFQRYLIPQESFLVRRIMQRAGELSLNSNLLISHIAAGACAVIAVALSFFNTFSYLLTVPVRFLLNVVRFDFVSLFVDFGRDWSCVARSLIFVAFGVTITISGFFFPATIFPYFAPAKQETVLDDEVNKIRGNEQLKKQVEMNRNLHIPVIELHQRVNKLKRDLVLAKKKGKWSCSPLAWLKKK